MCCVNNLLVNYHYIECFVPNFSPVITYVKVCLNVVFALFALTHHFHFNLSIVQQPVTD